MTAHGFIGPRPIGRGMKVDRQEIIGLVVALDAWFAMDHEERYREQNKKYAAIAQCLEGIKNVSTEVVPNKSHMLASLRVVFNPEALGKNAQQVVKELYTGTPRIIVAAHGDSAITINAYTLNEGEEGIIASALRNLLTGKVS